MAGPAASVWAGEGDGAGGVHGDGPAAVVDEVVVERAEQDQVRPVGAAAVAPPDDVVGVGGVGGFVAAGGAAAAVDEVQPLAQAGADVAGEPAVVEVLAERVGDEPVEPCVAQGAVELRSGERAAVVEGCRWGGLVGGAVQVLLTDDDGDGRAAAAGDGQRGAD